MARTREEIWTELDSKLVELDLVNTEVVALQVELNEAMALPPVEPEPPIEPEPPVEPPVEPEPPIVEPGPENPIPSGERIIRVPNGAALTKLLEKGEILPGTVVRLHPDGEFGGRYVVKNSGTAINPIVFTGEQANAGRLTTVSGSWVLGPQWLTVRGQHFVENERKVEIWGKGCRVNRCRFLKIGYDGAVYLMGGKHALAMVDRCEFIDFAGAAIRGELKNIAAAAGMSFHRNLFRGHSPRPGGDNESVILILTDAFSEGKTKYHRNLFERCLQNNSTGQGEIISIKIGATELTENTVIDTEGYFSFRETNRSAARKNWTDAKAFIKVFGDDHQLVDNYGAGVVLEINRGDAYATDPCPDRCRGADKAGRTTIIVKNGNCKVAHTATRRAVVARNTGLIVLGNKNDERYGNDKECQSLRLVDNATKAQRIGDWSGVSEEGIGKATISARKLTPAEVGIKAP